MATKLFLSFIAMCLLLSNTYAMEELAVLTRYDVKKGHEKKMRKQLGKYVRHAIAHENNIMAEAYYEQDNPSVLWLIERWSSSMKQLKRPARSAETIYIKDLEPIPKSEWRRLPEKDDKPITIMLFVDSKAGTEGNFKEVYHTAMPQFRGEAGVINYQLSQLEEDSTRFVTYEKFRSEDAFQYHLNFPPIQPVIDYLNTSIRKQPFQAGLHRLIEITIKK